MCVGCVGVKKNVCTFTSVILGVICTSTCGCVCSLVSVYELVCIN